MKTERLLNLVLVLLYTRRPAGQGADPPARPAVRPVSVDRGLREDVRARQGRAARARHPAGHRGHRPAPRGRAGLPHPPARVRPARHRLRARRARRARPRQPDLGAGQPRRTRRPGAAQAAGGGGGARRRRTHRHRAAAAHDRAGVRRGQGWRGAARAAALRLPASGGEPRRPSGTCSRGRSISWHGHWYLTAFDVDRGAPRVFRLSRIVGDGARRRVAPAPSTCPTDHEPRLMVEGVAAAPRRSRARRCCACVAALATACAGAPGASARSTPRGTWSTSTTRTRRVRGGAGRLRPRRRRGATARARRRGGASACAAPWPPTGERADGRLRDRRPRPSGWRGCSRWCRGWSTVRASTCSRRRTTSASASSSSRPTSTCCSSAATARCPTSSSRPTGRRAGCSSATPRPSPDRSGSASTRP